MRQWQGQHMTDRLYSTPRDGTWRDNLSHAWLCSGADPDFDFHSPSHADLFAMLLKINAGGGGSWGGDLGGKLQ